MLTNSLEEDIYYAANTVWIKQHSTSLYKTFPGNLIFFKTTNKMKGC
jgi:hypothetical protein